jgi:nicotinate-nucleotide--dimethylbenzimidazole phosphoribosyltransferase
VDEIVLSLLELLAGSGAVMPSTNTEYELRAREIWNRHIRVPSGLGQLEEIAIRLAGIRGSVQPGFAKKRLLLFCGDHGVAEEGVSAFPQSATGHLVRKAVAGTAAAGVFCRAYECDIIVVDVGTIDPEPPLGALVHKIRYGTYNFAKRAAMSRDECSLAMRIGFQITAELAPRSDIICLGEIGIGNTTSAAALMSATLKLAPAQTAGCGTGISREQLQKKVRIISGALDYLEPDPDDPLDCLSKVGGFEIAALVGAICGAAFCGRPVVIDGFATSVAALLAARAQPDIQPFLFFSHLSREKGHKRLLQVCDATWYLDLGLGLGEGTGAVVGSSLLSLSARLLSELDCF